MRVITRKRVLDAIRLYPDCASALRGWYQVIHGTSFQSFAELRRTFNSVDRVGNLHVFDVGGNKLRVIAAIHFNTGRVYVREILTHADYDKGNWRT